MSSIDQYQHKHIGFIECPSDFDFVYSSNTRQIAVYQLLQDVPEEETNFDGKKGDIIVGGGAGEAQSLRVSKKFISGNYSLEFDLKEELYKHFWSPSFSFKIGNGFQKLDWEPNQNLDEWLASKVASQFA